MKEDQTSLTRKKRYTIIRELGRGAFATVYLAHDEKLNRQVAIKSFHKGGNSDAEARFTREVRVCQKLRHPNVIQIYDAYVERNCPKIVMEYVKAGDLADLMSERTLTIDEALSIAIQMGEALSYLHSLDILHRDIKPENIMIETPLRAILMDFNLAYSNDFTLLTQEGFVVGTPRFMAPELLTGVAASRKSDIYGLGLILYEMITGGAESAKTITLVELADRHIEKPSIHNKLISPALDRLVLWAVEKDIGLRCPSMDDFVKELTKIQQQKKTPLKVPGGPSKMTKGALKTKSHQITEAVKPVSARRKKQASKKAFHGYLRAVLILLVAFACGGLFMYQRTQSPVNNAERDDELLKLATACDISLPEYEDFKKFADKETKLYEKASSIDANTDTNTGNNAGTNADNKSNSKVVAHCKLLRTIISKMEKGTAFFLFAGYRYELRFSKINSRKEAAKSGLNQLELLKKSNEAFWQEASLSGGGKLEGQDTQVADFLFLELWDQIKGDKKKGIAILEALLKSLHELNSSFRETNAWKGAFHANVLCSIYLEPSLIPKDSNLLFQIPPYDSKLLKHIRNSYYSVTSKNPSPMNLDRPKKSYSQYQFEKAFDKKLTALFAFLKSARIDSEEISAIAPRSNPIGFLIPESTTSNNLEGTFTKLIRNYASHTNLGWYLMNLSNEKEGFDLFLMEAITDFMQYSWYGLNHNYSRFFKRLGKLDPTCSHFAKTYSYYWKEAATNHLSDRSFASQGYVATSLNEIVASLSSLHNVEVNASLAEFFSKIQKECPQSALACNVLAHKALGIKGATPDSVERSLKTLLKVKKELNGGDFDGWAAITCVLSNELFSDFKRDKKNEERAALSTKLISVLASYYRNEKLPERKPSYEALIITGESNGENLLKMTLIHCYDACILNGTSFEMDHPQLANKIKARQTLKNLTKIKENGTGRGEYIAAAKLLRGKSLNSEDILVNPLLRR